MTQNTHDRRKNWAGRTDGAPWMQRALIGACRILPLWMPYSAMSLVALGYIIGCPRQRKAIYRYFRQRQGYSVMKSIWSVYKNHVLFGSVVLDRFMLFAGKRFSLDIDGYDIYKTLNDQPEGFVMFGSHTGNFEMAGYELVSTRKKFYVLAYSGETETVTENRRRLLSANNIFIIPTSADGMSHLFALNNALAQGDIVSLAADRTLGSSKFFRCNILGADANLPAGPFMLAAQRNAPAIAVFVNKTGYKKYKAEVVRIDTTERVETSDKDVSEKKTVTSRERAAAMAQAYADRLTDAMRRHPLQWFNYFEFWN